MKRTLCALFVLAIMIIAGIAGAAATGQDLFLVSVGRGPGAQESFWYATMWVYNPSAEPATVDVSFLQRGVANQSPIHSTMTVKEGQTVTVNDVLFTLFGFEEAFGALRITSSEGIVVAARSYNLTEAGLADSQGQFMAALPVELAIGAGESASVPGITQPADGSFRSNFAVVEATGAAVDIDVRLFNPAGRSIATKSFSLEPYEPKQINVGQLQGTTTVGGGRIEVSVTSGSGRVLALGSMVGNGDVSQDPSTLEMEFQIETSVTAGDGDITAVIAGGGLSGGGVTGDVTLNIANNGVTTAKIADSAVTTAKIANTAVNTTKIAGSAVTTAKIVDSAVTTAKIANTTVTTAKIANTAVTTGKLSPAGSSSGQILTSNGSGVVWQDPPAGTGSGDITGVIAGGGLTGGGTTGDVTLHIGDGGVNNVRIANNAVTSNKIGDGQVLSADLGSGVVTKGKLSAAGGSSGQVLGTNGSALVWQSAAGFSLPYSGSTTASGDAFYIGNTGSGRAIQASSGADTALWAHSNTGLGIDARSDLGVALVATSNGNDGIRGLASAAAKSGVYGQSSNSDGYGVVGRNTSSGSFGGLGHGSFGVYAESTGPWAYAVFVTGAGYFSADVNIGGNLNVTGTKNFRIDHPFDPTGSYLVHAAVESSEVLNQYSGTANLDEDGTVRIELESWFGAINTDLRYQLTAIGTAAPNLHISREVVDNSFEIAGGSPGLKVSWQITARRNDAYMQQYPFEVEVAKTGVESGTYLCPECHDQPESKSTETAILREMGPRRPISDD